jgi:hypothetical protein
VGGEECVREQLPATTRRGGTLCQEGHQAEGGHCPLQWYQGMYCRYVFCMSSSRLPQGGEGLFARRGVGRGVGRGGGRGGRGRSQTKPNYTI